MIVKSAANGGRMSFNVPITVNTETASMACLVVSAVVDIVTYSLLVSVTILSIKDY